MRKLKSRLDRKALEIIYIAFIRPILEYAEIVWCNLTKYEENELEKIQLIAARIITGTTKLISPENLYKEIALRKHPHMFCTPSFTFLYSRKGEMRGTQNEGLFCGLD